MGMIKDALLDRKEQRKIEERLKKEAVESARANMTFDARLQEDIKKIEKLFEDENVTQLQAQIDEKDLANVTRAIYDGRLSEYKVSLDGNVITFEKEIIEI